MFYQNLSLCFKRAIFSIGYHRFRFRPIANDFGMPGRVPIARLRAPGIPEARILNKPMMMKSHQPTLAEPPRLRKKFPEKWIFAEISTRLIFLKVYSRICVYMSLTIVSQEIWFLRKNFPYVA